MIFRDRVAQTTNTSGLSDLSLDGGAVTGFLTFQGQCPTGKPIAVEVKDGNAFEIFEAVLNSGSPYTLTRGALIRSSTGSRIDLSNAANKPVYLVAPAEAFGPMGGRARFALTGGTAPDYTATFLTPIRALKDGTRCTICIHAVNATSPVSFAPDGLAAKPVKAGRPLRTLAPNRLPAALFLDLDFSETDDCWVVLSPLPAGVTKTISGTTYTVLEEDNDIELLFTNAAGCAVSVPQSTGQFAAPFATEFQALGGPLTFTPTTSTINGAASVKIGGRNILVADGAGNYRASLMGREAFQVLLTSEVGTLSTGTLKKAIVLPYPFFFTELGLYLITPQSSGSILTIDANKNGTTVLSTKITVDNTEFSSLTAATPPVISTPIFAKADVLSWDVDQIGNGTAAGAKAWATGYQLP